MFTETYYITNTTLQLYIYATSPGTAIIFSLYKDKNETVQLSKGKNKFDLLNSLVTTDGKEQKGVHVHASIQIILYGFCSFVGASDGYLAIPMNILSNMYIVPSFKVYKHVAYAKSVIGVVSTANTVTRVNIKLRLHYNKPLTFNSTEFNNGDTVSVLLSKLETFQISHEFDLSGSIITSSQPVAVVSGNKCNSINRVMCNPFTEMVLPTNQLDNKFIVPAIKGRNSRVVRVYCLLTSNLQIFTSNREFHVTVQKEGLYEFEDSDLSIIKSDKNVLVLIYPKEAGDHDSYMMTVYGIGQYKKKYDIVVPDGFTSYISVALKSGSADGFQIDQNRFSPNTFFNKTISGTTYTTVSYSISAGAHTITHRSNLSFGLWIYGDQNYDGYGFPGGMAYTNYP